MCRPLDRAERGPHAVGTSGEPVRYIKTMEALKNCQSALPDVMLLDDEVQGRHASTISRYPPTDFEVTDSKHVAYLRIFHSQSLQQQERPTSISAIACLTDFLDIQGWSDPSL